MKRIGHDLTRGDGVRGQEADPPTSLLERRLTADSGSRSMTTFNGPVSSGSSQGTLDSTSPRTPSSATAHRGPYSRPSFLDQRSASTRFTPYSRKPIFVGARKVTDEDALEPHLTSTAQRMIEILQRNSTPVVEGLRKVPLHSTIKSVKPISNSVRGGPPVTRSPFALDGNPASLPVLPQYLLPKVPSQTPLPKPVQPMTTSLVKTSPYSHIPFGVPSSRLDFNYDGESKSLGGGKIKGKTSRLHETVGRGTASLFSAPEQKPLVKETPHATVTVPRLFTSKPTAAAEPLPPRQVTEAKFAFTAAWPLKARGEKALANGLPDESDFWKRLFAVINDPSVPKIVAAQKAIPASSSTWPCPSCMIHNLLKDAQCVCCQEPRPDKYADSASKAEAPPPAKAAQPTTWSCPTCMVSNKLADGACVCCSEPRPKKYTALLGSSAVDGAAKKDPPAPPAFKFGFSSPTPATTAPPTSSGGSLGGFSFAPPKSAPETANFKFGLGPAAAVSTTSSVPVSSAPFKFGITAPASTAAETAPFTFGAITTVSSITSGTGGGGASGFKFGVATPTTSASPTALAEKSPLSASAFRKGFGLSNSDEGGGAPGPAANGNASIPETTPSNSNFKFPAPNFPITKPADPDAEISKYKFTPFSGGPKPPFSSAPAPPFVVSTTAAAPLSGVTTTTQMPKLNFSAPATTVTSSNQSPISFGGSDPPKPPPPFLNGVTSMDLLKKPAVPPSAPAGSGGFSFQPVTSTAAVPSVPFTSASIPKPLAPPPATGGFNFGISTSSATVPPSTAAANSTTTPAPFTFGAPTPAVGLPSAAPPGHFFTFGQGESHKRKAPPSEEVFQFGSSEPQMKMRGGPQADGGGMKTGSFLDAMKQPGFGVGGGDKPDGRISAPPNNTFGGGSGGFNNPNAGFQFPGMNTATALPPQPKPTPQFNFGGSAPPPSSTPLNNNAFTFGSPQPSSNPQFTPNLTLVPNFSFGQNPGTPSAPVLFSAGASPAPQPSDGRRPAKRAVRRLR